MLTPPADLSEAARSKWDELAPLVAERVPNAGAFEADLLRQYCDAYALRALAKLQLATEPLIITSPNGARYGHPALKVIEQAERVLDRVYRRLGFGQRTTADEDDGRLDV